MRVLKPGVRLKSAVCETQVMVIKTDGGEHDVRCGGAEMLEMAADAPGGEVDPAFAEGSMMGKRYVNADESLEFLCTKGGKGSLSLDGAPILAKQAKALPTSD
ncbi:hypothetical protein [Phenylobacterium sp.]|jgi:hypothetical protein|uniref:hypothetical protein n=1 Tax=Phenylobacterium sp. TaxID=1871053 RepID=UPI002F417A16